MLILILVIANDSKALCLLIGGCRVFYDVKIKEQFMQGDCGSLALDYRNKVHKIYYIILTSWVKKSIINSLRVINEACCLHIRGNSATLLNVIKV